MQTSENDPSLLDIYKLIKDFGEIYHGLHLEVKDLRDEVRAHRVESRAERHSIDTRLTQLSERIDKDWAQFGLKLDQVWLKLDEQEKIVHGLIPGEDLRRRLDSIEKTGQDNEHRIARIEQFLRERLEWNS